MSSDPIIGIDLGTSNSCVAVVNDSGQVGVLADEKGRKVIPSALAFHPQGQVLIGHEAKQRRVIDPKHTVLSFKRIMGRRFGSAEVREQAQRAAYTIKAGANEQPVIAVRAGEFTPPELSAILLDHMRQMAARAIGQQVRRAVVTVPANFNDAQRQATALAGEIADLVVVRILNEPTAAALAYGHGRALEQTVAVYDFGGGTLDVTLLALRDNVYEVLATAGDTFLGGDDIDERIVDYMASVFLQQHRIDLRTDDTAMQRLRAVAEQVKIELSTKPRAVVTVQEVAVGVGGKALDLQFTLTRDELVKRIGDVIERSFPVCDEAFRLAGLAPSQIDEVVLVGGTTRMPLVRERVTQYFNKVPRTDVNPDEAVALGAALQGSALASLLDKPRRPTTQTNVVPPAGLAPPMPQDPRRTMQGTAPTAPAARKPAAPSKPPPVPGASPRTTAPMHPQPPPTRPSGQVPVVPGTRTTGQLPALPPAIGRVPVKQVAVPRQDTGPVFRERNPVAEKLDFTGVSTDVGTEERTFTRGERDDVVEMSGVLELPEQVTEMAQTGGPDWGPPSMPNAPRPILLDVTPRGLCVATVGGYCDEIIKRNSQIPIEQTRVFTTAHDHQSSVEIRVGQGESRQFAENTLLGTLVLEGLEPRTRGAQKIAVTFEIDTDGILQVRAVDQATQRAQSARIELLGVADAADVDAARQRLQGLRR